MFLDVKSPSKGKAREETTWSANWWDFYPLVELPRKPLAWTTSSVIITPHPTEPYLVARHSSSSKQFTLPAPAAILSSPKSYDPATVISTSASDDFLFAYFPGRGTSGIGAFWYRGQAIDNWTCYQSSVFQAGSGVVAAQWLNTRREWTMDETGNSVRAPLMGPVVPISTATLVLVGEDRKVTICYRRQSTTGMTMLACSLEQPDEAIEKEERLHKNMSTDSQTWRKCICAAVGTGYGESSIIVATRCHVVPLLSSISQLDPMDLASTGLPLDLEPGVPSDAAGAPDESCGEESTIALCEVKFTFDGFLLKVSTRPLSQILGVGPQISSLHILPSQPKTKAESEDPTMYLVACLLDFGHFSSLPRSELILYALKRTATDDQKHWVCEEASRFQPDNEIVSFLIPPRHPSTLKDCAIYVGLTKTSGSFPASRPKLKDVTIGTTRRLMLPHFTDDPNWEPASLVARADRAGRDVALSTYISPNETQICAMSASVWSSQTFIQMAPVHAPRLAVSDIPVLSTAFVHAVLLHRSTSDITQVLAHRSPDVENIVHVLTQTFNELQKRKGGSMIWQALGSAMEIYRMLSAEGADNGFRTQCEERWTAAHDLCSLVAINTAFDNCAISEDQYDLDCVWNLVGLSTWVMRFVQSLLKECILLFDMQKAQPTSTVADAMFSSKAECPAFLTLVHPQGLKSLKASIRSVHHFRMQIGSATASGENAQIAKEVLVDLVDGSGIDLAGLDKLLDSFSEEVGRLDGNDAMMSLAACQPMNVALLRKIVDALGETSAIVRSRLFLRPEEFIDGVTFGGKERERDVVTKGVLLKAGAPCMTCLRCGGQTETGTSKAASQRWMNWERMWRRKCICGGAWVQSKI